jgi:DNA-binding MarR family transcriptional regulator
MPTDPSLEHLAAELTGQWVELGRFFLSRKLESQLHSGIASELSPVQVQAVSTLSATELHIGELAARVGLAESTTTRLVDRLERLGLVNRHVERADRRSVTVALTSVGRRVAAAVERDRRAFLTEMLEALAPAEREEYVRLFAKATAALAGKEEQPRAVRRRRAS